MMMRLIGRSVTSAVQQSEWRKHWQRRDRGFLAGLFPGGHLCCSLIDRMEDLGYRSLWEADLPHVTRWFKTIKDRPAYLTAYYHGARYSEVFPDLELGRRNADVAV